MGAGAPEPTPALRAPAPGGATLSSIGRGFAVLLGGQILARLLSFVVTVHLTRALLAEGFGAIAFATSVVLYAALIVDIGFDTLGPLEVARRRIPPLRLVGAVVTLRLTMTLAAFAALVLFAWLAPLSTTTRTVVLLYGLSLVANALDLNWFFLGSGLMRPAAFAEILTQGLQAAGAFLLINEPAHLVRMPLVFLASRLVTVVWLGALFVRRIGRFSLGFDVPLLRELLPVALPCAGSAAVGALMHNFDLVIVGLWLGNEPAGLYGAAYRVVWIPTLMATAYYTALRPALARASVEGFAGVQPLLGRSNRLSASIGIGISVGGILVAEPLILFLFGPAYRQATRPLQILLGSFGVVAVSRLYRVLLVSFGHQALDLRIMGVGAALNVVLNLLLIGPAGLPGAAFATLASEATLLVLYLSATRRRVGRVPFARELVKPAVCSVLMGVVLIAARPLPILPAIGLGAAVYLLSLLAWGVIRLHELDS